MSEDCLSVNVIPPAGVSSSNNNNNTTTNKLPVAVFFNPGGWYEGGKSDPRYNTSFIIQQGVDMGSPFIAVSPNYRLSLWGFMYSQEVVDSGESPILGFWTRDWRCIGFRRILLPLGAIRKR